MAKYTFFEHAQQQGYVVSLMSGRVLPGRENLRIIEDPSRGRVMQMMKVLNPDVPIFEYVIPDREPTESQFMWRERVKKAVDKSWAKMLAIRAETKALRLASSGKATTEPSESSPSKIESSLTDAPQKPESSLSESVVVESVQPASDPVLSTPVSSETALPSSKGSNPRSRKSASKSPSSSGA